MSLFRPLELACPACGSPVNFDAVYSVNADRAPELRAQILDESFQRMPCPACAHVFRLDPDLNFVDHGRRQWIAALPLALRPQWQGEEAAARARFERVYGPNSSAFLQRIGATLRCRVTFGWAGLREKLLAVDQGVDDVTLELCKAAVLRGAESAPIAADTEMRLIEADPMSLTLAWLESQTERPLQVLRLERSALDELATDPDWDALRDDLGDALYVDIDRLASPA